MVVELGELFLEGARSCGVVGGSGVGKGGCDKVTVNYPRAFAFREAVRCTLASRTLFVSSCFPGREEKAKEKRKKGPRMRTGFLAELRFSTVISLASSLQRTVLPPRYRCIAATRRAVSI